MSPDRPITDWVPDSVPDWVVGWDIGGRVCARGYADHQRLTTQELLYTGVVRTPAISLAERVPLAGEWTELAAEHFAATADGAR